MDLSWKVFVADTRTGRVVEPQLPFLAISNYEYGLNLTGGWGIKVPIDATTLSKQDIEEISDPWRFTIGVALGNHIAQMGPLVGESFTDDSGLPSTDLAGSGIWDLLNRKRLQVTGDVNGSTVKASTADVVFGPGTTSPKGTTIPAANKNLSLHTIAKRLVEISTARTNANLPISLPADIAGTSEREYPGYDLAYVGQRLQELTQDQDGPEVEFRPQFVDDSHAYVQWVMRIGTPSAGGRLGNLAAPHVWEYGHAMTRVDYVKDGSQQTHARYERGGGTERDLIVGYAANSSLAALGWPLIEDAGSQHSSATEQATLDGWASAAVSTYSRAVVTWSATVRTMGDDGRGNATDSPPLYEFAVGDCAVVQMAGHARIRDGRYTVRILSVGKGSSDDTAKLSLQVIQEPS